MISYIFGDESGDFKTKPYFLIGFLKVRDYPTWELKIEELREKHDFTFEIKYSSTNSLKVPIAKDMIDLFFESDGIEFKCIVKSNLIFDISYYKNNHLGIRARDVAYNKTYCEVIKHNINVDERVVAFIDDKSRLRKDNLLTYLKEQIPQLADVQPRDSKDLNLLQFADLLTGSVYGNLTNNNHPVKKEIQDHVLEYLPINDFKEKLPGSKFNVWHWKAKTPPNT